MDAAFKTILVVVIVVNSFFVAMVVLSRLCDMEVIRSILGYPLPGSQVPWDSLKSCIGGYFK